MNEIHQQIHSFGIDTVEEKVYTFENEEVKKWTTFFHSEVEKRGIFNQINKRLNTPSKTVANTVGVCWYEFSDFMPWYLVRACSLASNNQLRHYIIQTAYEELGMRKSDEIHPEMFFDAAKIVLPNLEEERAQIMGRVGSSRVLDQLRGFLEGASSDEEILGQMLALEIPAEENIETTFQGLSYSDSARLQLAETQFFQIHRAIELEHVRLNVSNFLRFCNTEEKKERFLIGFDKGLVFWKKFWDEVSETIDAKLQA